jgi:hypothetical protein
MAPYECCHMVTLYIAMWQHYVLPHGNIHMVPHVNTLLCDIMVGWCRYPTLPSLHHTCTHIHHQVYEWVGPSLNSWSHGGIQMP